MQDLVSKTAALIEALPYIQRFRGSTFVVKYGGSFMDSPDPEARRAVARDIVFLAAVGIRVVVVHGGGKAITRALTASGLPTKFVQGQRVTDADTVEIVDRVLSREINPGIVETVRGLGGSADGFSGADVFQCRPLRALAPDGSPLDLGFVGEVTSLRSGPIEDRLAAGGIPIISPTARDADGALYNCNADVAAAMAAIALKARRLVFMSDVPGLLADPKNQASLIPRVTAGDVARLKKSGVIDAGMIPKVDSAIAALAAGVEKVQFVDGRVTHSILLEIFTDEGVGTELVHGISPA
jgi:acetylglutamate kinase